MKKQEYWQFVFNGKYQMIPVYYYIPKTTVGDSTIYDFRKDFRKSLFSPDWELRARNITVVTECHFIY